MTARLATVETVQLSADEITLRVSLADTDPEVVAFAKSGGLGDNPVAGLKGVIRLGVLAGSVGSAQSTVSELRSVVGQVDALQAVPAELAAKLGGAIRAQLCRIVGDEERPGALAAAIDAVVVQAVANFTTALKPMQEMLLGGGPEALPQLLDARLAETLGREARVLLGRVFALDGSSPLMVHLLNGEKAIASLRTDTATLEERLRQQITELTQAVIAQNAKQPAAIESGNGWEADSLDDLARATAILGDNIEATGTKEGHGGSRAGDHVLHVADGGLEGVRVVVECRTGTSRRLTTKALRQAVDNRDAHAGLLLSELPVTLPRDAEVSGFRVYFAERLVVLHHDRSDPGSAQLLAIAVQAARLLAKLAATSTGSLDEREHLQVGLEQIEGALTHLRPLRAAVTGIDKECGAVHKHAAELEMEIRRALTDLTALLAA